SCSPALRWRATTPRDQAMYTRRRRDIAFVGKSWPRRVRSHARDAAHEMLPTLERHVSTSRPVSALSPLGQLPGRHATLPWMTHPEPAPSPSLVVVMPAYNP